MTKNGTNYQDPKGLISDMAMDVINGDGDCVIYKNGSLYAAACDQPAYFICENEYANTLENFKQFKFSQIYVSISG